jgi:hypothetical protein
VKPISLHLEIIIESEIGGFIAGAAMTIVVSAMAIEFYKNEVRK